MFVSATATVRPVARLLYSIRSMQRSLADRLLGFSARSASAAVTGFLVISLAPPVEAQAAKPCFTRRSSSE